MTATSVRTPEISSLKRSSIGWLNSKALPIWRAAKPSIRSISASLVTLESGQSLWSFSTITASETLGSMGSTAASAVPVRENMVSTSGWAVMVRSSAICMASDCSSEAEGTRTDCMAMSPSSSVGTNSRPRVEKASTPTTRALNADTITVRGLATAWRMTGSTRRRTQRMMRVSCSRARPSSSRWTVLGSRTSSAAMAGTKVKEKMKAPASASITVAAMGMKVLPSTPSSSSSGMNTSKMMSWPKPAGRTIFLAAAAAT